MLGVFNFDVSLMIGVGCLSDGAYVSSLATSFALVVAVVALVGASYLHQIRKLRREAPGAVADMSGTIREVFDRFDADASGTVDEAEMLELVWAIDESATPEQAAALFRHADADGDGAVGSRASRSKHFCKIRSERRQRSGNSDACLRPTAGRLRRVPRRGRAAGGGRRPGPRGAAEPAT